MRPGSVYVYYRVSDGARATPHVAALLADVEVRTGVRGVLQRRADDPSTWMEVFAAVSDIALFLETLAHAEARAGIAAVIDGARHRECFVPLEHGTP